MALAHERLTFHESRVLFPTFVDSPTLLYLATADDGSGPWVHALDVERRVSKRINTSVDGYTSIAASATSWATLPVRLNLFRR
jgi:hypothetical protein